MLWEVLCGMVILKGLLLSGDSKVNAHRNPWRFRLHMLSAGAALVSPFFVPGVWIW